jgi:hypothetical protein
MDETEVEWVEDWNLPQELTKVVAVRPLEFPHHLSHITIALQASVIKVRQFTYS